ncbi:choice-of-anchor D domain-containing protein [Saccharospirillum salsuginis]|uniref:Choice-of-anchor D domain-containing protein n=1 Tax=Saccharospirillum salsuginis TaxID=418750 RepID=A0A918NC98_9GAMM|nr:choice-of-anchor D domain-containing protein [Saccharospirillum salsuginis]GGX57794.1 hypothetical protein GCM10007392_26800 [Saccharospirillum salsuginis]
MSITQVLAHVRPLTTGLALLLLGGVLTGCQVENNTGSDDTGQEEQSEDSGSDDSGSDDSGSDDSGSDDTGDDFGSDDGASAQELTLSAESVDFGTVASELYADQTVLVTNTGIETVTGFTGGTPDSPRFSLTHSCDPLLPGASCTLTYRYEPTMNGRNDAVSTLSTSAGDLDIALTGASVGSPLWVTPTHLEFGPVGVGAMSDVQSVTLTNQGNTTIDGFAGGAPSGDFTASQDCASGLAPGATCSFNYRFTPSTTGTGTGESTVSTSVGSFTIQLTGEGKGAEAWVTPTVIDFGEVEVDDTSATRSVTITNVGQADLDDFAGGAPSGPFSASQTCAGGVVPDGTCQYNFTFSPTSEGEVISTSNSSTNAGPIVIELRGEGVAAGSLPTAGPGLSVSPLALDFGPVAVGGMSPTQTVTIVNTGDTLLDDFAGGGVGGDFTASQNCASGVAPGESCQYFFSFEPTEPGEATATSTSSTNAGSFSIELTGTGVGPEVWFTPKVLNFGTLSPGTTSATQSVTITNSGMSTLDNFAGGAPGSEAFTASQSCASGVEPGATCQYNFTYSPDAPGFDEDTSNSSTNAGSIVIELEGGSVGP